jgi:energy-coupling factor transporter ATP-binding protein EcfA2
MFFAESVEEELTFGLRRLGVGGNESRKQAAAALDGVGLDAVSVLRRQPFDLSYGEMRRVAFAVAGVLEPALVLLDEPTACLDPGGVALFYRLLDRYRNAGTTVMVASHDRRALDACDRVVTIDANDCGR